MLTKIKEYETFVALHAQKLFHLIFCIVRDEELAKKVSEKVFLTASKRFMEMEKEAFEKYLFQLAAKMAVACNKTARNQQINKRDKVKLQSVGGKSPLNSDKKQKQSSIDSLLIEENQRYTKLVSKQNKSFV